MRRRRLKIEEGAVVYYVMTCTVNGARLLDGRAKEVLRKQLWPDGCVFWGGGADLLYREQPLPCAVAGADDPGSICKF
jgi:hypothetical protein